MPDLVKVPARQVWLLTLAFCAALLPSVSHAQDPPTARREAPRPTTRRDADEKETEEKARPADPSTPAGEDLAEQGNSPLFYMLTRDGELVLASNITYEDIQEYFDLKQGLRQQTAVPKYAVTQTDVKASVVGDIADLVIRVDFEITAEAEKPIAVPLNLGGLVRPEFQYRGNGKQFVVYDGKSFVCWMTAPIGSKHSMTIKAVSPVVRNDDAHRLTVSLPYAPSKLQLDVPVTKAIFGVSDQRSSVVQQKRNGKRSQATIDSRGGDLEIRWSPAQVAAKTAAPLVFASTSLNVRIDNQLLLRVDAEIEARAARGELTEFDIRLPAGLKLTDRRATGYTISDPSAASDGEGQVVRVKLDTPAQRAPRIRLSGEITLQPKDAQKPLEVWGFEVVGANQTGDITLLTGDEWVVTPLAGENVRRDRSPPENVRTSANSIRFTVVSQPSSLKVAIRPKLVRVVVDPTYHLDISPTKTELELRLVCRFGNGRPLDLELPLEGWDVKEIFPERLEGSENSLEMRDGKLIIPLGKVTDAPMGDAEVIIRAERIHEEGAALELPLTAPQVGEFSPGLALVVREPLVVAIAANNIELTPDMAKMPNVKAENVDLDALPEQWRTRQQTPFAMRADAAPLAFHATQKIRPRSVIATPSITLDFNGNIVAVSEVLRLEVSYEPLSSIRFAASPDVTSSRRFQVLLGEQQLTPEDLDANGFSVNLPESQLGEFELTIRYELPLPDVRAGESPTFEAAILLPTGGEFSVLAPTLRCLCPDDLQVELSAENGWTEASAATRSDDKLEQLYKSTGSAKSVTMQVRSAEVVSGSITVERMWVQTWLTEAGRRERAVFRVTTPSDTLSILLPQAALVDEVTVAADGFRVDEFQIDGERIQFTLPESGGKQHLIELWYGFGDERSPIGSMDLEMPAIGAARRVNQFYWELITPRREHLFTHPATLTSEMQWRRRGLTYGRETLLTTEQLAESFGASATVTPADANRYLFSSLGSTPRIQAYTIRRSWLVLMVASGVMMLGAAWLALRGNGRSLFFLVAAVAIGSLATIYPNPAVVTAQAGFLGLAFLTFSRLLRWAFWPNRSIGVDLRGAPASPTATIALNTDSRQSVQPSTTRVQITSESGA